MNGFQVKEIIERLDEMIKEMEKVQKDLEEYNSNMKGLIERLENEGLPREFVDRFREDHLKKMTRYFNGLAEHIENESVPYTKNVREQAENMMERIG